MKPTDTPDPGYKQCLAAYTAAFAVAACVSMAVLARHLPSMLEMDSLGYYKSAINLMRHGVFSEAGAPNLHPISFRTPGYPFVLAGLFRLVGPGVIGPAVLNLALLWLTGLATMRTAHVLGAGPPRSLLAGVLVALSPLALFWATQVYTDTLFVALLALGGMLGSAGLAGGCAKRLAACALVMGLLPLVRPVGFYVTSTAAMLAVVLLAWRWRRIDPGRRARTLLVSGACLLLACTPTAAWIVRNKAQFGTAHFCEIGAWNLRFAHMNVVLSRSEGADFGVLFADSFKETYPQIYRPTKSPGLLAKEWTRESLAIAQRHPGVTMRVAVENLAPLFSPSVADWRRGLGREGEPGMGARLAGWLEWALVLGVAGAAALNFVKRWRLGQQRGTLLVLAGTCAVLIAVSLPAGNMTAARFRLPLWPLVVLMAVAGPRAAACGCADQRRAGLPDAAAAES